MICILAQYRVRGRAPGLGRKGKWATFDVPFWASAEHLAEQLRQRGWLDVRIEAVRKRTKAPTS